MTMLGRPTVNWDDEETPGGGGRLGGSGFEAEQLCISVESRMDELVNLIEEETALVRTGKLFAAGELQGRKAEVARQFIAGMEAVKKIRPALEKVAPDAIERLKRRHEEFKAVLQMNLAVLATAREVSENLIEDIAKGVGQAPAARGYGAAGAIDKSAAQARGLAVNRSL